MPTRQYDFDSGVETPTAPTTTPPAAPGDVVALGAKTRFTLVNNQASAANVTSVLFDKAVYRSFVLTYQIYRSASGGQTRAEVGIILGVTNGTTWEVTWQSANNPNSGTSGITFSITSSGQLQYTSDDNGGSYSAANSVLDWELLQLMAV